MFEGDAMVTAANLENMQSSMQYDVTTSTDVDGNSQTFIDKIFGWVGDSVVAPVSDFFGKYIFFEYTLFYNVDPITGARTANDLTIVKMFLMALGIGLLVDAGIILKSFTRI